MSVKLMASNPAKRSDLTNRVTIMQKEFVSDVRLIFSNSLTFNGRDHAVTAMGKRVEKSYDKASQEYACSP